MAEVKVVVHEAPEEVEHRRLPEMVHKALLASIGAVALAQEAVSDRLLRWVERGERIEQKGRDRVRDRMERRRHQVRRVVKRGRGNLEDAKDDLALRLQDTLTQMRVPTKNDIDALSAKISALSEKVDELKKA